MEKFSDKMGFTKTSEIIQVDFIDMPLRTQLYNAIHEFYFQNTENHYQGWNDSKEYTLYKIIWTDYFGKFVDKIPHHFFEFKNYIQQNIFIDPKSWYEPYNFIQFLANISTENSILIIYFNHHLKNHLSGYTFINRVLSPITNKGEINSIENAIKVSKHSKLQGVQIHIKQSLLSLSSFDNPDYRTSIKESISAIESTLNILNGTTRLTFSKAFNELNTKLNLPGALVSSYKSLYGFTSDKEGIRHFLTEKSTLDQEDAIYFLVNCSSFINYLVTKSKKAGIFKN
ncbi:AbiJ-NTD4 domain-containing protein [Winogradskyella flava]|uniref:AbiJ-NTD4 domain-containing protein n=1 Tax=Winogradskyella flava TaxID=1884876 RepID=UPI002492A492|nr:hypothetical protein [Winogradskyella flava]